MRTSVVFVALLFGVIVFVAETNARPNHAQSNLSPYYENREEDLSYFGNDNEYNRRGRRTRHSRQIVKRYDYSSPWFYENDRNYMILQELRQIKQLLEKFPDFSKDRQGSGSPQQPIYIPVPIYLPAQGSQCSGGNSDNGFVPDTNNRINIDSESNPIWGYEQGENAVEGDDDGARPISFKPVKDNRPQGTPSPPVEHGSVQAGVSTTAAPSTTNKIPLTEPGKCEAAILSCCRFNDINQKICFQEYGCVKTYETGLACTPKAINAVILHFKQVYGPR